MSVEERLSAIEARLWAIESRLGLGPSEAAVSESEPSDPGVQDTQDTIRSPVVPSAPAVGPLSPDTPRSPQLPRPSRAPLGRGLSAGTVLGWTGAAALVLAAAYLIRLGVSNGWLTPERQIGGAALAGFAMVGGGLALRLRDKPYSSLLGAAGIAVLYLTIFGAHVRYGFLGPVSAAAGVVLVAALSLSLHALFREGLYVAFALAGSYACPLLIPAVGASVLDLAMYLTVWNGVYCGYAFWVRRRVVYFAALYASLLIFDDLWRGALDPDTWLVAALFQLAQFLLFTTVVVAFSVRLRRPLLPAEAWAHFPALLLFYGVEYDLLERFAPGTAPLAAVAFALALYGAYGLARARLPGDELPSLSLVHAFGALVLFHALYVDVIPSAWRPLAALLIASAIITLRASQPRLRPSLWPYTAASLLLFSAGYAELLWTGEGATVLELPLIVLYPLALYAAYFTADPSQGFRGRLLRLAVAHGQLLLACAFLIDRYLDSDGTIERLWLSFAWALVGTILLIVSRARRDRMLARSTLGIFALFAFKVLLFDLSEARPLVRVGCLAVLGVSLYAGGWIYRRVLEPAIASAGAAPAPSPVSPPV